MACSCDANMVLGAYQRVSDGETNEQKKEADTSKFCVKSIEISKP